MLVDKRSITPQKAVEILRKHGTIVTVEDAKLILDFMYKFTILAISQIVKHKKQMCDGKEEQKPANYLPGQKDSQT